MSPSHKADPTTRVIVGESVLRTYRTVNRMIREVVKFNFLWASLYCDLAGLLSSYLLLYALRRDSINNPERGWYPETSLHARLLFRHTWRFIPRFRTCQLTPAAHRSNYKYSCLHHIPKEHCDIPADSRHARIDMFKVTACARCCPKVSRSLTVPRVQTQTGRRTEFHLPISAEEHRGT